VALAELRFVREYLVRRVHVSIRGLMSVYFESVNNFTINSGYFYIINILIALVFYKKIKFLFDRHLKSLVSIKFSVILSVFLIYNSIGVYSLWRQYDYNRSLNEDYEVVEGVIEEHKVNESASREESFEVNGVLFEYNNFVTPDLFFANRNYVDNVIKNGIYVKVFYIVKDDVRYIVKLEV